KVAAAQTAVDQGEEGASKRLILAEDKLEEALEAVLDAECQGGGGGSTGHDSEESDSDGGPGFFDDIVEGSDSKEDNEIDDSKPSGLKIGEEEDYGGHATTFNTQEALNVNRKEKGKGRAEAATTGATPAQGVCPVSSPITEMENGEVNSGSGEKSAPVNFSRVDPSMPPEELAKNFPLFPGADRMVEVVVSAGQMLYLPAGWFHEVTSLGSEEGHMAFNYWFHPPDAVGEGGSFDSPYTSDFWAKDWVARSKR
ncbi:unnamed protein product, partial [Choristocarpus tenellus]